MEIAIEKVLNSLKNSIPNAHYICFVTKKSLKSKIIKTLIKYNIEILQIPNSNEHITNRRFIESYNYLKKKDVYKRVLHMDIDDIYLVIFLQQLEKMISLLIIIVIRNQNVYKIVNYFLILVIKNGLKKI